MNKLFFLIFFSFVLSACSSKDLYQFGQGYQKSECIKEAVTEAQHHECVNAKQKPFEQYEKEREEAKKK